MNHDITMALIQGPKSQEIIGLFGHSSKGIPGIEIIGLGKNGQKIKEKIIFYCKRQKIKLPLLRYCLCVELNHPLKDYQEDALLDFEIPLLLLVCSLAKVVHCHRMENFISSGRINLYGQNLIEDRLPKFNLELYSSQKWVWLSDEVLSEKTIGLKQILS